MFNLQKDLDSIEYWEGAKKGKLMIQRCKQSNEYFFYSRANISYENSFDYEWVESSGKGYIYSFTVSNIPGGKFYIDKTPYVVAIILLEEGVKIISNIYNYDFNKIKIEQKVEVRFKRIDKDLTLPYFTIIN